MGKGGGEEGRRSERLGLIRIEVINTGGAVSGLRVSGHAGMGSPGTDILCAAVSVLAENLGFGLRTLLNIEPAIDAREGYYEIRLDRSDITRQTDLLFASALLGLKNLAGQYPQRIKFVEEGD